MGSSDYKPAIGNVPLGDYYKVVSVIKMNLDMLTGRVTGPLQPLPASTSTAEIIATINAIIARLNAGSN